MAAREFHFSDGTSHKFWKIEVDGSSFTVHFGRLGTAGQAQTKEFGSEADAATAAEKLIAEKVKKGYLEEGATAAPVAASPPRPNLSQVRRKVVPTPPAEVAAPPAVSDPTPSCDPSAPRELALAPGDWHWASWRPRTPAPRPEAAPFDLKDAAARLGSVASNEYLWNWDWNRARIAPVLSREEAHFWVLAMTNTERLKPKALAQKLMSESFEGKISLTEISRRHKKKSEDTPALIVVPLSNLFGPAVTIDTIIGWAAKDDDAAPFVECFRSEVLPYLTNEEVHALRKHIRPMAEPDNYPVHTNLPYYPEPPAAYLFAAVLGLHDEMSRIVERFPDDRYPDIWDSEDEHPQLLIFGLGDAQQVEHHLRRLKLRLHSPAWVRAWLAHTEFSALDLVRDEVLKAENRESAEGLIGALGLAKAPETARYMLELMLSSRAPAVARTWLDEHPAYTAAGLVPVAAGRGKQAEAALELLRALHRSRPALLAAVLEIAPEEAASRVRTELSGDQVEELDAASTPAWLTEALTGAGRSAPPSWVSPAHLPPLLVGERRLSDTQVTAVLTALAKSTLEAPTPAVVALKQHLDRGVLDRFAWRLFELWLTVGAPSKEKWALLAVGLLGGDASALKLGPMIRAWPGESQHQRAVTGLECLRTIGSDTALMQISGIAQKVPFKGLKAKAGECMEAIARDRGLTRPQLEDRIVPDCELNERGSRTFDFGPRQFRFVLGAQMKPMVREADGKIRPDLPKPSAKDDAALAAGALEEWKLLKKQVAEVAKTQAIRLEQAMVTGRRWSRADFEQLLVRHPLMTNLVRLLVWGAYNESGELMTTFRVTEDQTYADRQDEALELDTYPEVGIVHPLRLSDEDKHAWGELFSDYELIPPFSQLGRPIHSLREEEGLAGELQRWAKIKIPPQSLVFTLEKLDWQRGIPEDAGLFYSHSKPFYGANITAVVEYEDGVPVGYMDGWDDQELRTCYFIPGIWRPEMYPDHKQRMPLVEVDPVVISEVLSDLTTIASKAK